MSDEWSSESESVATADRGINDVLGYIIIFSIIVVSIGFVMVSGLSSLQEVRDDEQVANAERAFDVVHDNMAQIYERNAPSRATEVDLADSEIFFANNVSVTIDGDGTELASYQIRPVEMRVGDGESLVYEAGAVFRDGQNGAIMRNEPPFLFKENRVHVPIIQTTAPSIQSAGSTTILLRGKSTNRSVIESDVSGSYNTVTIEIASPRYEAWENYFQEFSAVTCTTDDATETVECNTTSDPEIVYITLQRIEVSLIL